MEQAIIGLWVEGQEFTYQRVADMVAPRQANQPSPGNGTARDRLKAMALAGLIEERDNGERKRPYAYNRSGTPLVDATLARPVAAYLADVAVDARTKSDVVTALRFVLRDERGRRVETRGADGVRHLATVAERILVSELQLLPLRCTALAMADRQNGLADAISPRTEATYVSSIRGFLRYVAEHRLAPLVFSVATGEGPWEEVKAHYLSPRDESGKFTSVARYLRSAWDDFRRTLMDIAPGQRVEPNNVTEAHIAAVHARLREQGKLEASKHIRHLWNVLTKAGFGPLVGKTKKQAPLPGTRVQLADGRVPSSWPTFAQALEDGGFAPALVEQVRWYGEYVTLSEREIRRRRNEFPSRPSGRSQKQGTVRIHVSGLRTWIGAALDVEGMTPATATPDRLFGTAAADQADAIATWWEARAKRGEVAGDWTTGLKGILIPASMFALGCYERAKKTRGATLALKVGTDGAATRLDRDTEEAADKTAEEAAYYAAYREIQHFHEGLVAHASKSAHSNAGSRRGGPNALVDVLILMRTVPPSWWQSTLDAMISEVRAGMARDNSSNFHRLVQDTVWTAMLISTGCRGEELAHIRFDIQAKYFASERRIMLRKADRKNVRGHTVFATSTILPEDVLQHYLEVSRPFFMRNLEGGSSAHPFLFVKTDGAPIGCPEEAPDGNEESRDGKALDSRLNSYRSRWQSAIARHAVLAGVPVPAAAYGVLGFHSVRRVHGFMVYLTMGLEMAANYLGDHPNSVMGAYAAIAGDFVDVASLRNLPLFKHLPATAAPAQPVVTADVAPDDLDVLVRAWGRGLLTDEEFTARKEALQTPRGPQAGAEARKLPSGRAVGVR
jgi:hypothetical protein